MSSADFNNGNADNKSAFYFTVVKVKLATVVEGNQKAPF